MKSPKKVCFVVDTLANHGAERYLYEILKAIDKKKYDCHVLSVVPLEGFERHYISKIEALSIPVIEWGENLFPNIKIKVLRKAATSFAYRVLNKIQRHFIEERNEQQVLKFLAEYDKVIIIKWEVYSRLRNIFDQLEGKILCVLSSSAQYPENPYEHLPKGKTQFIVMYDEQKNEILDGRSSNENYTFQTVPLLIDTKLFQDNYNPGQDIFRIGIFSRIEPDQPTLFSLFLLHLLHSKGHANIELHFFGKNTNKQLVNLYVQTAKSLRIADNVFFKGHTFDIGKSINDTHLNLAVMNNLNGVIGYSSIELILQRLPVLFFNVARQVYLKENVLPIFNSIEIMANDIITLKNNTDKLAMLNNQCQYYIQNNHDIRSHIKTIETQIDY